MSEKISVKFRTVLRTDGKVIIIIPYPSAIIEKLSFLEKEEQTRGIFELP